jgi:hypothetical protein
MSNVQTNKLQQILAGALILQIALAAWAFWPRQATTAASGPLLPDVTAAEVSKLVISDVDRTLTLAKEDGEWVLPEADDFPVTAENVTRLLENIEKVQTNRLVTQTETSHKRLQVAPDDFNRRIEITTSGGETQTVYVGSSAGSSATHVRLEGQPEVYLTGDLNAFDITPQAGSWIDTLYFTVPQTATTKIMLENKNGSFEFSRAGDGEPWSLSDLAEGETLNENTVTSLLTQLSSLRITEPLGQTAQAGYGLDDPLATVTLESDNQTYTLQVGARDEASGSYTFKASSSPYYVRVAQFTGDDLVNKTRADFLEAPPAEESSEEGTPLEPPADPITTE